MLYILLVFVQVLAIFIGGCGADPQATLESKAAALAKKENTADVIDMVNPP